MRRQTQLTLVVALTLLALTRSGLAQKSVGHTKDSLATVKKNIKAKKAILVDVREKREWKAGHLSVAHLLPLTQLRRNNEQNRKKLESFKKLAKGKIIYCHCKSGGRVLLAAPILRRAGLEVRPLKSGYSSLLKAGFEKAKPKKSKEKKKKETSKSN